jgi:prepilin-type N-terminal cleavage/methylation domain-containing protein
MTPAARPDGARARRKPPAFTLTELLVVVAIIAIMAAAVGPAFNAMLSSRGVDAGVSNVVDFLEMARNEAVTRQTYVWVGITGSNSNSGSSGYSLNMAAEYSLDATGVNTTATNMIPFTKLMQVKNVACGPWSQLSQATSNLWTGPTPTDLFLANAAPAVSSTITFTDGGNTFGGTYGPILTFTPEGQVLTSGTAGPYTACQGAFYDFALVQARGSTVISATDQAGVVIDAATGTATIVQLH